MTLDALSIESRKPIIGNKPLVFAPAKRGIQCGSRVSTRLSLFFGKYIGKQYFSTLDPDCLATFRLHQIEYQRAATVCDPAVAEECVADYLWYGSHLQQ